MWDAGRVATRKYEQRLRADTAEQTRRRVLDAVGKRLRESPTERLSVDRIAQEAGVARSTIYVVFGSRAGLLDAFAEDLWARTGLADLTAAVAEPDARKHLRGGILAACRMLAKDLEVYRVLHAMGRLDPDSVGGAVDKMDKERRGGMRYLARRLKEDGVLRDDVTQAQAADLLWMLSSFEAFDRLHTDRGMSVERAADVLATTAERTLCK
jgi:AcrR family transcriptional regulator